MRQFSTKQQNWLLAIGVILLTVMPLLLLKDAEFGGTDNQGQAAIQELHPTYEPWFQPLVQLPGSQIESLLFAVQAAAGAGTIGYVIGLYKGRSQRQRQRQDDTSD